MLASLLEKNSTHADFPADFPALPYKNRTGIASCAVCMRDFFKSTQNILFLKTLLVAASAFEAICFNWYLTTLFNNNDNNELQGEMCIC